MKRIRKMVKKVFWYFVFPVVCAIVLRVFFFEMYKIPSSSMEPTLVPGDYILVNKMNYGARLIKFGKLHREKKLEYVRAPGWGKIKRGDVLVFNWPNYGVLYNKKGDVFGDFIVKRCYGMPGDTVVIKDEELRNEKIPENIKKEDLFPHDTLLQWTVSSYGPLFVPGKNKSILLTPQNARHYKDVLKYEGFNTVIRNDSVFLNGKFYENYTFTHNFYFMKGDNFYGSIDSRYWGFVPEDNIIGKAGIILFSSEKDGFKWIRLLKIIH